MADVCVYVSLCAYVCGCTRVCRPCAASSDGFNFHFPYLRFLLPAAGLIAAAPTHLPMLTRNARGVHRFYRETSVFTFRYNYALMCGDRVGSGFA